MKYRLIIVDDEKEISNGFAKYFPWAELGYTVAAQFTDAVSALRYLDDHEVDLVVSDVIMPDMSGLDFARSISERPAETRPLFVLFSAYDKFEYAQQAIDFGCSKYILKSTCYDELISIFSDLKEKLRDRSTKQPEMLQSESADHIIASMMKYTAENLAYANLEMAAKAARISVSYASRYFKQKTGMSYIAYVQKSKMEYAAKLLSESTRPIGTISEMVGYANAFNFSRCFKAYFNQSPREYRNTRMGCSGDTE